MVKVSRRHAIPLAAAALLAALAMAGVWLHVSAWRSRVDRLDRLQSTLDASPTVDDVANLRAEVRSVNDQIAAAGSGHVSDVVHEVSRLLAELHTSDRSISTSAPGVTGPYQQSEITVNYRGSLDATFKLLDALAGGRHITYPRLIDVTKPVNAEDGLLNVKLQFVIVTRRSP